jgi:hypothetical protein
MRWIKIIKDYKCVIDYHHEKANVVMNALSINNQVIVENSKIKQKKRDNGVKKARYLNGSGAKKVIINTVKDTTDISRKDIEGLAEGFSSRNVKK